jgi:cytochrome P450
VHTVSVAANSEFYWPASWPEAIPRKRAKRRALATLTELVDRHLRERQAMAADARPDDLLTRLLQLHRTDPAAWPLQAVRDECMTAFLAGHETVAATLTWWAWCLAAHPQAQRQAAEEVRQSLQGRAPTADDLPALRALTQTLQEAMRLYPAAPVLISRRCTRPITLGPWQLPARTMFMVPVQLMHLDPRWFEQPLAFRPERFAPGAPAAPRGAYKPFGAGPRVCHGQHLATTEMVAIAVLLLQRFALSVPQGQAAPRPLLNVTLRPESPLHLRLSPAT